MADVEVWVADAVALADRAEPLLSAAEAERSRRYVSAAARRLFVLSRALQRLLGSARLGVPADRVEIGRRCRLCTAGGDHGKPYLEGAPGLDYSVSHAGRLVLLAWSPGCRVGVDVEWLDRRLDPALLGARTLAAAEQAGLDALPAADRPAEFLRLWTRKEAAVKLAGHGLTVPLAAVRVDGPTARLAEPPPGWPAEPLSLTALPVPDGYTAALATTASPRLALREVIDLRNGVELGPPAAGRATRGLPVEPGTTN
ncbi:4'-phosphopantetheinyl transferase [Actinocatenispora thailandica]|uniref:4'-phosphopantetheinyl transferase n=1 Tax=Actinocatenispora thailandica TaxID=227318 RepID=A0A7R7HVA6_9ACTN|nr:4'-phosphopantetheinyl transferase superfamily protein [Actinocatenispora thailandica]BCJ33543.1 4'-phosphopantetheinyl transferase [Actinocatenispora thailandica]